MPGIKQYIPLIIIYLERQILVSIFNKIVVVENCLKERIHSEKKPILRRMAFHNFIVVFTR
jgi:hypothetical protein